MVLFAVIWLAILAGLWIGTLAYPYGPDAPPEFVVPILLLLFWLGLPLVFIRRFGYDALDEKRWQVPRFTLYLVFVLVALVFRARIAAQVSWLTHLLAGSGAK
jgi:hypothetical protein